MKRIKLFIPAGIVLLVTICIVIYVITRDASTALPTAMDYAGASPDATRLGGLPAYSDAGVRRSVVQALRDSPSASDAAEQIATTVGRLIESYRADTPASLRNLAADLRLGPPDLRIPPGRTEAQQWPFLSGMVSHALFDTDHVTALAVVTNGREVNDNNDVGGFNRVMSVLKEDREGFIPRGDWQNAVDVVVPGEYQAVDQAASFRGTMLFRFAQTKVGGPWLPQSVQVRGWPVGIRVLGPPL